MPNISYRNNSSGTLVAVWPGFTIQTDQGPRKQGQKYLGKVIDKDRLIFWKRDEGYFHFNPDGGVGMSFCADERIQSGRK